MTLQGIDISYAQATTPLDGLSFVIARATYGIGSDVRYAQHAANVRAAGLVLGAYAFGIPGDGAAQAAALLATAPDADFYVLDIEAQPKLNIPEMPADAARKFIRAMHKAGHKVGLYHSLSGFPSLGQDWNWVAAWDGIDPGSGWTFHQDTGGPLDHDIFAGDAQALAAFVASQEVTVATKPTALTPSAEPVVYAGLITSLILAGIQLLVGQGMLTSDQATQLNPQAATIANALVTLLPVIAALITRQAVTPNGSIPTGLPNLPTVPSGVPTSGPDVFTPMITLTTGVTVVSSVPTPGLLGHIAAGTRRWTRDGVLIVDSSGNPSLVGPSDLEFASLDELTGKINGHFYLTATDHPYYTRWQDVTDKATSPAPTSAPAPSVTPPSVTPDASWFATFTNPDEVYLQGGSPNNPNGCTFTYAQAITWFTYVLEHGVGYHHVRPTLLPGSRVLTQAGYAAVVAFEQRPDLVEAPEDFNPLRLPVIP